MAILVLDVHTEYRAAIPALEPQIRLVHQSQGSALKAPTFTATGSLQQAVRIFAAWAGGGSGSFQSLMVI